VIERPQRGQCARAHMSSCCPQRQSVLLVHRAWRRPGVSVPDMVSVRLIGVVFLCVIVMTRRLVRRPRMTQTLR
jgi:hypothetical protein